MDRSDASALADLQMHWDEAYVIGLDGDIWLARFHGSADELRAHTSTELRELIRADYAYRQQVRRVRAAATRTEMCSDAPDDNDSNRTGGDGDPCRGDGDPGSGDGGTDTPDLDDDDLDDDYAAHFDGGQVDRTRVDGAQLASGHFGSARIAGSPDGDQRLDAEPGGQGGLSRAAVPHESYANLRERMST